MLIGALAVGETGDRIIAAKYRGAYGAPKF
jgi:hypothetical protein